MNTVEIIKDALDDMTRSERQVATYYLANPNDFAFCTLDAIAGKIDTSTTSVLRFCRRIGFQGYKDLQQAARQQISLQPQLPDKFLRSMDNADDLLVRIVSRDIQCIRDTFQNLSPMDILQAVSLICGARNLYMFGMRESYCLAHYGYTRLLSVRPGVELLQAGSNGQIESILNMNAQDVCVAFLFHRYTQQTIRILELLARRGVSVILVTDPPYSDVESLAEVILPCVVDRGGIKNSSAAPVVLLDYLCDAVAAQLGEAALEHMNHVETLFRQGEVL